jgi:thioredoxin 1
MKTNAIYILTNENFQNEVLNSKQPVLVEFSTEWCGTSHIIAPIIKEMAVKFKDDIKFCKIDIDDYEETAKKKQLNHMVYDMFQQYSYLTTVRW